MKISSDKLSKAKIGLPPRKSVTGNPLIDRLAERGINATTTLSLTNGNTLEPFSTSDFVNTKISKAIVAKTTSNFISPREKRK